MKIDIQENDKPQNLIKVCDMIAQDMENDARAFDGKPFTGLVVGTEFGAHGAAIAGLAEIIKEVIILVIAANNKT